MIVTMSRMTRTDWGKVLQVGRLDGSLEYFCKVCRQGPVFAKLSDLRDHLLAHSIDIRDMLVAVAENQRRFDRVLLRAETLFSPRYRNYHNTQR